MSQVKCSYCPFCRENMYNVKLSTSVSTCVSHPEKAESYTQSAHTHIRAVILKSVLFMRFQEKLPFSLPPAVCW